MKNNETCFFYVLYSDKNGFLTNQSMRRFLSNLYYKRSYYLKVRQELNFFDRNLPAFMLMMLFSC